MNKKFIELMGELDRNELVFIGAKEGSSWIFIETVQTVLDNIEKMDRIMYDRVKNVFKNSKNKVDGIPYKLVKLHDLIKSCKKDKERKELLLKIETLEKNFVISYHTYIKTKHALDKWIKLQDRMVLETYPNKTKNDFGVAILIEGNDQGTLWFKDKKKYFNSSIILRNWRYIYLLCNAFFFLFFFFF